MKIKEYILPRLPKAIDTGFHHKSAGHNCYSDYDVTECKFEDVAFFKMGFVAKFMVQNKESFEKLILRNVRIEARGIALTNVLKDKVHKIDLKVIHMENVTLSEKGLKSLVVSCSKMKGLKELYLINMPGVRDNMHLVEKAFVHHKTLEVLNLS